MTLTELLIVVAVMVILLGLGLPMLKTGLEGRKIREASRQLNTYVEMAKALAVETGRPAGLILDVETLPMEGLPEDGLPYVSQVFLAQTPPPYVGDMVTARATITSATTARFNDVPGSPPYTYNDSASLTSLIQPGDRIRFDYRGVYYDITTVNTNYTIVFSGSPSPPVGVSLPYQIYRQPEKSGSMPMEMAAGAVIDLSMSGFGLSEATTTLDPFDTVIVDDPTTTTIPDDEVTKVESVIIEFSPSGEMTRVLVNKVYIDKRATPPTVTLSTDSYMPTKTLHLLVGRLDGVLLDDVANVNTGDDLKTNIENPESLWVSIGHQTGRVTTAENGWTIDDQTSIAMAREFAQSGKAMGGQ